MGLRLRLTLTPACLASMVAAFAAGWPSAAVSAGPLVRMTRTVWGCVDPNVAPAMNDPQNPSRLDAHWVEKSRTEGECVSISPRSVWEPLSQDHNGLTYVTYRGTTGKPGSFWVPTTAMTPVAPAASLAPPSPAATLRVPAASVAQPASARPASPPRPATIPAATMAPPVTTPVQPPPDAPPASNGSTSQGGSAGGGLAMLLVLLGGGWLVRRLMRRGKHRGRAAPVRASKRTQGSVPTTNAKQPTRKAPPPVSRPSLVAGSVTVEVQPSRRQAVATVRTSGTASRAWHPPGLPVTVAGVTVPDGMVYVGRSTGQWGEQDGSFIDPALPVALSSATSGPLGYWPSYRGITPECRRRYLEWLASGKQAPEVDVGYVFLYFYGLERRLVIDTPTTQEIHALVAELQRLRTIYAGNGSFNGYSNRLLEAVAFLQEATTPGTATFVPSLDSSPGEMPPSLKVAIAREVVAGRPLGFELAAAALFGLRDFCSAHRHVLDQGRTAFLTVLRARFDSAFPVGLTVRNRKDSHLALSYRGASAGLSVDLAARAGLTDLPDPTTLTWTKLLELAAAVAEEVAPYAKALAYHPARAAALYGLVGCPPELRDAVAPDARRWLESLPSPAAVSFGELAGHAIGTTTAKWTVRHRRQVSEALSAVGYAMEPDPDDGTEHLEDATTVQVFRCADTATSRPMEVASAAAILVAAVSRTADGGATMVADHWLSRLPSRLTLTADQTTRLRARLAWLNGKPVTLAKARRVLGDATADERELCAWSATVAAGAAGDVGKPQVALLEAIHDALEVPRGILYAGLHAGIGAATTAADEPVLVSEEVSEVLHPIPSPPVAEPVDLVAERLARIRAETERVSSMLADIFVEDEPQAQAPNAAGDGPFAGLEPLHAALLERLLSRPEWPRAEFDAAASEAALMPGGAMETINEWAFDHLGDAILEDGDVVVVHRALVPTDPEAVAAE